MKLRKLFGVLGLFLVFMLCVPNVVNAATMSDEFKSYLNEDGEFVVNAAKGTTEEDLALYLDFKYTNAKLPYRVSWGNVANDLNSFAFTIHTDEANEETHNVKIKYIYDEKVNIAMNNYLNSTLKDKTNFKVTDMELVSYWLNNQEENENSLALYSGELKRLLDYKNIQLFIDNRAGGSNPFITQSSGFASFRNAGITYKIFPTLSAYAEHIIYIDESVGNTEEEIVEAVQKRIDNYFGKDKVTIFFGGDSVYQYFIDNFDSKINFYEFQISEYNRLKNDYETNCENNVSLNPIFNCNYLKSEMDRLNVEITNNNYQDELAKEKDYKAAFILEWNKPQGSYTFLKQAVNNWFLTAEIDFGGKGFFADFIVVKDSSKMVQPIIRTADASTNVEISSTAALPLDTVIQVKELNSGQEYEKIVKLLNLTDNLTFDLKLYSNTQDKYITKLDSGEFEVKIPIPENFKGKDLVVYYVDENNNKEPYTVQIENGYAIFKTTHFSIYTLGYKEDDISKVKVTFDANGGKFDKDLILVIDAWQAQMYDSLTKPTRNGYKFKGYYTEKTGGTKFEMILNEAGIENNSIFYAQWEAIDKLEEVPKTFDGIGISIFWAVVSLIGLIAVAIYYKKRNKVRV